MYKVGVIGLGAIAAMYATPASEHPYCHVGGIRQSGKVELAAAAELSEAAREKFAGVWGEAFPALRYYDGSAAMLEKEALDIVAVCVRGPYHYRVVMEAIEAGPRAIFLEKPPSCSLEEMDGMVEAAARKGIPVVVSYSRHWNPHILRLQQLVREGLLGEVKTVVAYCGHYVLSFASHTTDLICQFAGYEPEEVYARGTAKGDAPTGYEPEPTLDHMTIRFANGVTGVQVGGNGEHGSMYAEVFGEKGMLRVGMYTPTVLFDAQGQKLDLEPLQLPAPASVFTVAYDQIADYLDGGPLPHCTDAHFVAVNEIGFGAIESMHTGRAIPLPVPHRTRKVFANE
ncbi:Gfo/Idh/MocA family protein [Cohnella sp. JJ-181]|uniref:Gfo/Idh/MocA family protein n=1 Tax=Cohnella rhizoplanae TaxID=2974897 RepID=UPI0022FF6BEC|nr:Gfo/Idh/MocA family oxidoreductase [Cohnella sp. JJ-181]CAI6086377.1 Inositol 2-dehydrogenase/D-chiro-inositol 3-dehydrogenase [Cohnella sp. JJ-181]